MLFCLFPLLLFAAIPNDIVAEKATFAGGCFWCMEQAFEEIPGVLSVTSGYIGGTIDNPTYQEVSAGKTGHAEAIEVVYDPTQVNYKTLLENFWKNIDPTVKDKQFCDIGRQYRTAIFTHNDEQKKLAEASKADVQKKFPTIYTEIVPAGKFYKAEDYHQNYYKNNPIRYKFYKYSCGRDARLNDIWGDKE